MDELEGRPEYCLDLSFMYALLRLGYEFGEDRDIRIGKQVITLLFLFLLFFLHIMLLVTLLIIVLM